MEKLQLKRPWDVSMPLMEVFIDDTRFIVKHHSSIDVDIPEGTHKVTVRCGGYSSTRVIDTRGKHYLSVTSILPNWFYAVNVIALLSTLILYSLGKISLLLFGLVLLAFSLVFLIVSITKKRQYFKIIAW